MKLKMTIPVANELGECILWDDREDLLLWTDILGKTLYYYNLASDELRQQHFDEELCAFAMVEGSDELLCAFRTGFALLDRASGQHRWVHRIDNTDVVRLNDGRVDRQGRFWCGTLIDNEGSQPVDGIDGELLCMNSEGSVSSHLSGIRVSNSTCWSPDGKTMYFSDTLTQEISAFNFCTSSGTISDKRLFARAPEQGFPDGSIVDADGFLWNAEWGQGRVVRYAPNGSVDMVLQLPVSQVTCLAFGGAHLNELYITTAKCGLTEEQSEQQPEAGDVFVYETPFSGLKENRFVNHILHQE